MLRDDWQDSKNTVCKMIAKSWMDSKYRERFIAQPKELLKEEGVLLPEEVEVKVDESLSYTVQIEIIFDSNRVVYTIGLPPKPADVTEYKLNEALARGESVICWR